MFKKSVFIMLFVCLLAAFSSVASAADPWDGQLNWIVGTPADGNWANVTNWQINGSNPTQNPAVPPGAHNRVCILPNQPGPKIGLPEAENASCSMLDINPWDPSPWGGQDCNVTVMATALDVNCGVAVRICTGVDYDSYLGTTNLVSRGILNVYGGTVRTPNPANSTNLCGIGIGGGSSGYGMAYGMLNIYGGEVNVPRVELDFGEIGLYGGTLQICTDSNFSVNTTHPRAALNKIRIDGGTLILDGNQIPILNTLITGGFIVCQRGTLGTPTWGGVDSNWTTLAATDINYLAAWNPQPANNAIEVHYKVPSDGNSLTLSWNKGTYDTNVINQNVYFGTDSTALVLQGTRGDVNNDPCSWTLISTYKLLPSTKYYWRVDEVNTVNGAVAKGWVWNFTTHNGKAYNPKPANASTGLNADLKLRWTAGDWVGQHQLYVGTNYSDVFGATTSTPKIYRGAKAQTDTTYDLRDLANNWYGPLVADTNIYWRITEVNGTTLWGTGFIGGNAPVVWNVKTTQYLNIDDFEDSQITADVNTNWLNGYPLTGCTDYLGHAGLALVANSTGKYLQYTYNNGGYGLWGQAFSEAKHPYPGGTSFTGGGIISPAPKALRIDYLGAATNAANYRNQNIDPPNNDNDQMYVAIEDTAGNISLYLNPDHYAQRAGNWTSWYTNIYDINNASKNSNGVSTNLNAITGFSIGFGVRCDTFDYDVNDANSVVMFDNIRLYAATCVPAYGPSTDLDGDCDVDINDLAVFASYWLWSAIPAHTIPGIYAPHKDPVIWYPLNEGTGNTVHDSGPGAYTVDVCSVGDVVWDTTGGRNVGNPTCMTFNTLASQNTHIEVPVAAFNFMNDDAHYNNTGNGGSVSFSMWLNDDLTVGDSMTNNWATVFSVWAPNWDMPNEGICYLMLPGSWTNPTASFVQHPVGGAFVGAWGPRMAVNYFGGRWNHWAAVKSEPNALILYCNGKEVARTADVNLAVPFFKLPIISFRIGLRGGQWANWGKWSGKMQDFKVYDYALDANEVGYLATDGTGVVGLIPLVCPLNTNTDGSASPQTDPNQTVNFADLTLMEKDWLLYHNAPKLWP